MFQERGAPMRGVGSSRIQRGGYPRRLPISARLGTPIGNEPMSNFRGGPPSGRPSRGRGMPNRSVSRRVWRAGYNSGPPRPPLRRGGIQKPGGRRSAPAVDSDGNVAMSESGGDQSTREIGRRGRISPTRGRKRRPNRSPLRGGSRAADVEMHTDADAAVNHNLPASEFYSAARPNAPNTEVAFRLFGTFFKTFIDVMDSGNRSPLRDAYDSAAIMTFSDYPGLVSSMPRHDANADFLQTRSRNLEAKSFHPRTPESRVMRGADAIVGFHQQFPRTTHVTESLTVDLLTLTSETAVFQVTGVFFQADAPERTSSQTTSLAGGQRSKRVLRYFNRTIAVRPRGDGVVIANDSFMLSRATRRQLDVFMLGHGSSGSGPSRARSSSLPPPPVPAAATPAPSPALAPEASFPTASPVRPLIDAAAQQVMVKQFSQLTGMNEEYSFKCLDECSWDYDKSTAAFQQAKPHIPAAAFVR